MELPQTGGCQCDAVRYEITKRPTVVCHCHDCQRMGSSALTMSVVLLPKTFNILEGTHGQSSALLRAGT
jgi:hypothetical protein